LNRGVNISYLFWYYCVGVAVDYEALGVLVGSVDADAAVIVDPAALLQLQLLPHHSFSSFQTFYLPFFMDTLLL